MKLDPFSGKPQDDKISDMQNGLVTKQDSVISANILSFVRRATFEDDKFYSLPIDKQQEVMKKYADEIIKANSAAAKVVAMTVAGQNQNNPVNNALPTGTTN